MAWRGPRDDSGVRHGRGVLLFANGAREEGEFVHGTKQASWTGLCAREKGWGGRGPQGSRVVGAVAAFLTRRVQAGPVQVQLSPRTILMGTARGLD